MSERDEQEAVPLPPSERYELLREIARGGVGEVWLAQDRLLEREVALKVLLPQSQASGDARDRFLYEARTSGRLAHPGIIPVHDAGTLEDGRWFYAMEHIAGRSLAALLAAQREGEEGALRAFPLPRLLHLFSQVCLTVAYAHDHGVIHRDLKPDNVMLGAYGEVYVADWGLAKHSRGAAPESRRTGKETVQGAIIGTIHYMSPEQIRGDIDTLAASTDVWSLGVILYELLTLSLPFEAPTPVSLMFKIVSEAIPDPRESAWEGRPVPDPVAELCLGALTRSPERRTLGAKDLAARISTFLDGVEEQARRAERAGELVERARDVRDLHARIQGDLGREVRLLSERKAELTPATPGEERMELYRREQLLAERELEAEALYSRAIQVASQALEEWETRDARELLAELYWLRAEDAARAGDAASQLHFRSLVERHDTGRFADRLATSGRLRVSCTADGAEVRVERQAPFGPLLEPEDLGWSGEEMELPVGSYVVLGRAAGRLPVRLPVLVEGNRRTELELELPEAFEGHEEYVWVPPGEAVVGGDDKAVRSLPERRVRHEGFLIGRFPVTVEAYCEFLSSLAEGDPDAARGHAPRSTDGTVSYLDYDEAARRYSVPRVDRDGDRWDPRFPAFMIGWHDAVAYCQWRSEVEGGEIRLPTEIEWEIAARGVDGRFYPWGNGFDPTFCRMVDSVEGRPLPVPVGSYPRDRSPYGVQDLAGLIAEWTSTPAGPEDQFIQRGGSYAAPADWCRAATRRGNFAAWNTPHFGFRIVRATLP